MVLQKRLDYGIHGYQVPPMPHVPKSAKGKRSVRKKTEDNRMCAFDLLAAVAGKLLLEGESSSEATKLGRTLNPINGTDTIKKELENPEKPINQEVRDLGSCSRSMLGSDFLAQRKIVNAVESVSLGPVRDFTKSDASNEYYKEKSNSSINKQDNGKVEDDTCSNRNAFIACVSGHKRDIDGIPQCLVTSNRNIKVPLCADRIEKSFCSSYRDKKVIVDRDDDENFSGSKNPRYTASKVLKQQGIAPPRIRKQLATRFWKVATTITKDRELPTTDGEVKPSFHSRKICYTRRRTQRSSFKRRKLFQHCSVFSSNGRINNEENRVSSTTINGHLTSYVSEDFHVKLRIKSFKVPELFIEIPETSTVGSLKRTVMEAVTAILGGGLRVGVVLQGKTVRDDNKTLIQAGISHDNKLEDLGFTLEPNSNLSPPELPLLASPEEPRLLLPCEAAEPLNRFPVVVHPSDGEPDVSRESHLTPLNCLESDLNLIPSPIDTLSFDKTAENVRPLITIPSMIVEAMPIVPVHKAKQSDFAQRRIRRPFSVSEVEALVQAVEKLGTGRWRDVKIRAFDNARHRTYVDLKDKWKTLVHTAKISPQQRRGEPVPQELLDRVLSAHAYWTQQQAKLQGKSPHQEACLLI